MKFYFDVTRGSGQLGNGLGVRNSPCFDVCEAGEVNMFERVKDWDWNPYELDYSSHPN